MNLLGFDLAWTGATGWAHNIDGVFLGVGQFTAKGNNHLWQAASIQDHVRGLVESLEPELVAYEFTDWHRKLKGVRFEIDYKIERQAQRCLGRAETALLLACLPYHNLELLPVGANKAKKEFGATQMRLALNLSDEKEAVAAILAEGYPEFRFVQNKTSHHLYDTRTERDLSHNVSDAMMIVEIARKWIQHGLADTLR